MVHGTAKDRPIFKNVDSKWAWVIAIAGFFIHIIMAGQRRAIGLLFVELVDYLGESKSKVSLVVSVYYISSLCTAPIATLLVRWCSSRAIIATGVALVSGAFLAGAFLQQLPLIVLTVGFMSGTGAAFMHAPALVLIGQYFEKWRSLAVGVCLAGASVGAFVFPPLVAFGVSRYGYPGMMLILSGASLHGFIFALFMRSPELATAEELGNLEPPDEREDRKKDEEDREMMTKPDVGENIFEEQSIVATNRELEKDIERCPLSETEELVLRLEVNKITLSTATINSLATIPPQIPQGNCTATITQFLKHPLLKNPAFYMYAIAGALATELLPFSFYIIPSFCEDLGISLEQQTFILLIMAIPDMVARVTCGWIADRFSHLRTDFFIILLLIQGAMWLTTSFNPNYNKVIAFSQMVGVTGGAIFTLYVPILVDAVGIEHITTILSSSLVFEGVFCVVLPPVLAAIRDESGSWIGSLRLISGITAAAALMVIFYSYTARYLRSSCQRLKAK